MLLSVSVQLSQILSILSCIEICSFIFDEFTDGPKMTGSSLAANG